MRIYPKMLAVVCGLGLAAGALATNFVYDTTSLPATKSNLNNLPGGADPTKYIQGSDYNAVTQAAYDLRTAINDLPIYSGKKFGIVCDGTTDVGTNINSAIVTINAAGGGVLLLPAGVCRTTAQIELKSKVTIRGAGMDATEIKMKSNGVNPDVADGVIRALQADYCGVEDIKLNGFASGMGYVYGHVGIRIVGSSFCLVKRVHMVEVGSASTVAGVVWIVEGFEAASANGNPVPGTVLSSRYNIFEDSIVDDPHPYARFAMRILSPDFVNDVAQSTFVSEISNNIVKGCTFIGGDFVTAQIGGPTSKGNMFIGNTVKNWKTFEAFLVDKGAYNNTVVGNTVQDFTTPGPDSTAEGATAFRCQGLGDYGRTFIWPSVNNTFVGNTVKGWGTAGEANGSIPAAMEIHQCVNVTVSGNEFDATASSGTVGGIIILEGSKNLNIIGNDIHGGKYGIINFGGNMAENLSDWNIRNNLIGATYNGINLSTSGTYELSHVQVTDNEVSGCSNAAIAADTGGAASKIHHITIQGNKIRDSAIGIRSGGIYQNINGNTVDGTTSIGLYIISMTNSSITGNTVRPASGVDLSWDDDESYKYSIVFSGNELSTNRQSQPIMWGYTRPASGTFKQGDRIRTPNPHQSGTTEWVTSVAGVASNTQWLASHSYSSTGVQAFNGNRTYEVITTGTSASSGGPTGTTSNITDGTAHWKYVGERALFRAENAEKALEAYDYGCIGDGAANDTTCVTNMLADRGGTGISTLHFGAGSYKINASITGTVKIYGDGTNVTNFLPASTASPVFAVGDGTTDTNNVSISGATIYSDGTGASSDGIYVNGGYNLAFSDLYVRDFGRDGISLTSSATKPTYKVDMDHVFIAHCHGANIKMVYGAQYTTVISLSNFWSEGYNNSAAYALYVDGVEPKLSNGWFEIPGTLAGGIYLKATGGAAANLTMAGVSLDSADNTDTLIQFDANIARGYVADRLRGTYSVDGKAKWKVDSVVVDVKGGTSASAYLSRLVYPNVLGALGFNDLSATYDETTANGEQPIRLYGSGASPNGVLKNDGSAFRPMLTLALPLQGNSNGALWRDSVGELRWAPASWWPSADSDGKPLARIVTAPTNSNDPCEVGQVAFSSTHDYACTAHNTWVRGDMATW